MNSAASILEYPIASWLGLAPASMHNSFKTRFDDTHIGNPVIRSLHGGVIGSVMEICAQNVVSTVYGGEFSVSIVSSSVDYLRATHDADLYCQIHIARQARRVAFVDALCWQDEPEKPVARGHLVLRVRQASSPNQALA